MTFDEILKWAPDNKDVFDELLSSMKKGNVIPFVGAGMSAPVYPLWGTVLNQLTEKLASEKNREAITDILNDHSLSDSYTRAADKLIELRSEKNVLKDLLRIFNEEKIVDADIRKMTVYLLPFLFHDKPAITTNYDRILEHAYGLQGVKFDNGCVFTPDSDMAGMVNQKNLHCLFKIHGDIGKETLDGRKLILSGKSYDRVYTSKSELVNTLKTFYKGKMMLFLGSSLKYDRTLEILKQVTETGMVSHYAILPCCKEMLDDDSCFFGERGIRSIFYDPDHHEAVKIILEELLRGCDPDRFALYKNSIVVDEKTSRKVENPFVYDAGVIGFIGRDKEIEELRKFTEANEDLLWWVIIGEGGAGKTRLVYEFTKEMRKEGWNIEWIGKDDLKDLNYLNNKLILGRKNIIVADYGRSYAKELGRWMTSLAKDNMDGIITSRNRIIIIEREQYDKSSILLSAVTEEDLDKRLKSYLWKEHFLYLNTLSDENIKEIIRSYALYKGKNIDENAIDSLFRTLESVDPNFKRPLYAMFITDAYCENADPQHWDRDRVLGWVIDREDVLVNQGLRICTGQENVKQKKAIEAIRFIATIHEDISVEDIKVTYQDYWKEYERAFDQTATGYDLEECLAHIGIAENEIIKAMRPDLLGEYYVLKRFNKYKDLIWLNGWTENIGILLFVFRFTYDYREQEEILRDVFEMLSDAVPNREDTILLFAMIIVNYTAFFTDENDLLQAVALLESIHETNEEAAYLYAQGLSNLVSSQPYENKHDSVVRLSKLSEKYEEDEAIALLFAQALVGLISLQPMIEKNESICRLAELHEKYEGNEEIALAYAYGLCYLFKDQVTEEGKKSISLLRELSKKIERNEEIALFYANGLVDMINIQPLEEERNYLCQLRKLSEKYDGNKEIVLAYAKGLYNIGLDYPTEEKNNSIQLLKKLSEKYDGDEEIAYRYAYALVNLIYEQPLEKAKKSIKKLEALSEKYEGNEKIALEYAYGLINLLDKQPLEKAQDSLYRLKELHEKYKESAEIAAEYAAGLYKLSTEQTFIEMQKSISQIRELRKKYKGNEKINILYAFGLANLRNKNPLETNQDFDRYLEEALETEYDLQDFQHKRVTPSPRSEIDKACLTISPWKRAPIVEE